MKRSCLWQAIIIIDGSTICDTSCLCMFPRDQNNVCHSNINTNLHYFTDVHSRILIIHVDQALVVQKIDRAIHWINHYPVDSTNSFCDTYPLDSDLPVDSAIQLLNKRRQDYELNGCIEQALSDS